jgi:hypothetical protein
VHELEVIVLDAPRTVTTRGELAEAIASRVDGGNHFEIASVTSRYPMLDVLVRDPYAVVHYFPTEGMAGAQADREVADAPDEVDFPHSGSGETITMPGSVCVDVATAVECIEQFAETLDRPTSVDWIEL